MNRTADLEAALSFVIGRVNQQAALSGEPLDSNCQFERRGSCGAPSFAVTIARRTRTRPPP